MQLPAVFSTLDACMQLGLSLPCSKFVLAKIADQPQTQSCLVLCQRLSGCAGCCTSARVVGHVQHSWQEVTSMTHDNEYVKQM